jgi:hypothetical protein
MKYVDAAENGADAIQFCTECGRWTGHDMGPEGDYTCRICGGEGA